MVFKKVVSRFARSPHRPIAPSGVRPPSAVAGQAVTEFVLLIPLLLMLAGGAIFVVYTCSQGIKVQQAANIAARIQGQERIAGGVNNSSIQGDNGVYNGAGGQPLGAPDLSQITTPLTLSMLNTFRTQRAQQAPAPNSVYGEIQKAVNQFFNSSEQNNLFVPAPDYGQAGNSDAVKVFRVIIPPNVFGLNFQPVMLQGRAYGGEDPRAYGLPRWGSTSPFGITGQFWTQKDSQGNYLNLPKGHD